MGQLTLEQQTTPSAPSAGKIVVYPKTDDRIYTLNPSSVELPILEETFVRSTETTVTANSGTSYDFDLTQAESFNITLTGNVIFTITANHVAGQMAFFVVKLTQDGTGSRTVSWPASVIWNNGNEPTVTSTANKTDIFSFVSINPTTWFGFEGGQNF